MLFIKTFGKKLVQSIDKNNTASQVDKITSDNINNQVFIRSSKVANGINYVNAIKKYYND